MTAIRALGSIGPDAKAALPVLKLAEEEYRQEVERYRALGKMAVVQLAMMEQQITYTQEAIKKIGQ